MTTWIQKLKGKIIMTGLKLLEPNNRTSLKGHQLYPEKDFTAIKTVFIKILQRFIKESELSIMLRETQMMTL